MSGIARNRAVSVAALVAACALASCAWAAPLAGEAAADVDVYLAPHGSDGNSGLSPSSAVQTPQRAQAVVRATRRAPGAATVHVAAGRYVLSAPLTLDDPEGDTQTLWQGEGPAGAAIFDGGVPITNWAPSPPPPHASAIKGGDPCGYLHSPAYDCRERGCEWDAATGACTFAQSLPVLPVWEAPLPPAAQAVPQNRHLFVNGQRALRPRVVNLDAGLFRDARLNEQGFKLHLGTATEISSWTGSAELVWPQTTSPWTEPRCTLERVDGTQLVMKQPCFNNLRNKPCGQTARGPPSLVEAVTSPASDWTRVPGSFYTDAAAMKIFYVPRPGETPSSISAVFPVLETLIQGMGNGTTDKLMNVAFRNMSFQHATWLRPSQDDGYVEQQSGACIIGDSPANFDCSNDFLWKKSPGAIRFSSAHNISFSACSFLRFGGVALDFGGGAHACSVDRCYFADISGAAVQIGSFDTFNETNPELQELNNTVSNTVIERAAVEFHGAVGISVGYSSSTTITHNDVGNVTYGPISMGWGWSRHNNTYASYNEISHNKVHDYKLSMNDGGGIYLLGPQWGTVIHHNHVYNQTTASSGALYPDEGSAYEVWTENVVQDIGSSEWLHLWTSSIHNVTVENNYADTHTYMNHGTNCPMINNTIWQHGSPPPAAAQAIIDAAGPIDNPFV